jgi:hypothetical protein
MSRDTLFIPFLPPFVIDWWHCRDPPPLWGLRIICYLNGPLITKFNINISMKFDKFSSCKYNIQIYSKMNFLYQSNKKIPPYNHELNWTILCFFVYCSCVSHYSTLNSNNGPEFVSQRVICGLQRMIQSRGLLLWYSTASRSNRFFTLSHMQRMSYTRTTL